MLYPTELRDHAPDITGSSAQAKGFSVAERLTSIGQAASAFSVSRTQ